MAMKNVMLLFALIGTVGAQVPTGTIAGVVRDPGGAAVAGAAVKVVNLATNAARTETSSAQGDYSFPALPAGEYELSMEVERFQRMVRTASVAAGETTTADFALRLGNVKDSVTVDGVSPQISYDSHSLGGVIAGHEIQNLPLNGRSFLELAKLEPGVQPPTRTANNETLVPVLGAPGGLSGRGTRVTIDGGSIMAFPPNFASAMGFSQDVVQEFQISTVNFDLSTGLTCTGAISVATRSGGNDLHGSAFFFFRDHNLSAYPGLQRIPTSPDPFFQRRQFGFAVGGPIRRDRLFFFGNWERNEQRGVVATTLFGGDFAHVSRITPSPLFGNLLSFRLDSHLSGKHTAFLRYSHDGSRAFGSNASLANGFSTNTYPSNWSRQLVWADQSLLGVTSVLRPTLVNDFRFSYFFLSADQFPAQEQDCPGCLAIGAPMISIPQAGVTIGQSSTSLVAGRRFHLNDSVAWQRSTHRARFGVDWEHNRGDALTFANEPVTLTLFTPDQVRNYNTAATLRIPLPPAFNTLDDILQLPMQSIMVGIGDPRVPQANGSLVRTWNTARLYIQDTWRLHQRLTLNYGLAWNVDLYGNHDLRKPQLLAPILGAGGLGPTRIQWKNYSPALGLAWAPLRDRKTVVRAGAGVFYDYSFGMADVERALLGPPGLGLQPIAGTAIANTLPGVPGFAVGAPLNVVGNPTLFTGADLLSILAAIRAGLASNLANAHPSLQQIQITKQGSGLSLVDQKTPSAQHFNLGVQREIARDFVLSTDFVFRHFIHVGLGPGGIDLNHFMSVRGPVIPKCMGPQQQNDPQAQCSNGPISVAVATSNQTYKGLLLRADKRFSHGFQILGSYALSSDIGTPGSGAGNPTFGGANVPGLNLDNWHQKNAPLTIDYTHILNLAGVVRLPGRFDLGLNFSYSCAPPFSPVVGSGPTGIDFNGDGTFGDLLPGTTAGQFNRGLGSADLARLVDQFNQTYAGTADPHGRMIPRITLPASYSFDHGFQSLDLRLSRTFAVREKWRVSVIGEAFNLYNAANLSGYSNDLTGPAFGQPTARFTQLFGSGGPRAFQLAMRVSY
jgi:hypothetical protein